MAKFLVQKSGPLNGEVVISGAKNAALGILAAAIMTDEDVVIDNLPDVRDINVLLEAIAEIGAKVERIDRHTVRINAGSIKEVSVDDEFIRNTESVDLIVYGDIYYNGQLWMENAIFTPYMTVSQSQTLTAGEECEWGGPGFAMVWAQEENYYAGDLTFRDGLPVTTKADKDYHGFGMQSIRMIVRKYEGELNTYTSDGVFHLNILFTTGDF